ncbi:MAG: hypothetical protein AAB393_00510, partial [Bacteroidota bacterium]
MRKILVFLCCVGALLISPQLWTQEEQCASTGPFDNATQYLGTRITLKILLVEFTDVPHRTVPVTYTKVDFENMLVSQDIYVDPMRTPDNDEVFGSLADYFRKMSWGNLQVEGHVVNNAVGGFPVWIGLYGPKLDYHHYRRDFLTDAITAAQAAGLDVSTSTYAKLAIVYAGNTYFQRLGLNPQAFGDVYIMGELQGRPPNQENPTDRFSRIGFHCHEFAHTVGIDHSSGSRADVMQAGMRNGPDNYGAAPAPLCP